MSSTSSRVSSSASSISSTSSIGSSISSMISSVSSTSSISSSSSSSIVSISSSTSSISSTSSSSASSISSSSSSSISSMSSSTSIPSVSSTPSSTPPPLSKSKSPVLTLFNPGVVFRSSSDSTSSVILFRIFLIWFTMSLESVSFFSIWTLSRNSVTAFKRLVTWSRLMSPVLTASVKELRRLFFASSVISKTFDSAIVIFSKFNCFLDRPSRSALMEDLILEKFLRLALIF